MLLGSKSVLGSVGPLHARAAIHLGKFRFERAQMVVVRIDRRGQGLEVNRNACLRKAGRRHAQHNRKEKPTNSHVDNFSEGYPPNTSATHVSLTCQHPHARSGGKHGAGSNWGLLRRL